MELNIGIKSDRGRVRTINQDSAIALPFEEPHNRINYLLIVADGVGGASGGEVASMMVTSLLPDILVEQLSSYDEINADILSEALIGSIKETNRRVWERSQSDPDLSGMGTTCIVAAVVKDVVVAANVGDSRIYLCRNGLLTQVNQDHSLIQEYSRLGELTPNELKQSRIRNVITRAVGITSDVEPDRYVFNLSNGDAILLCSDGLTNMVDLNEIAAVLGMIANPQAAAEKLVGLANKHGGEDNVSVILARCGAYPSGLNSEHIPIGGAGWRSVRSAVAVIIWLALICILFGIGYEMGEHQFMNRLYKKMMIGSSAKVGADIIGYSNPRVLWRHPLIPNRLSMSDDKVTVMAPNGEVYQFGQNGHRFLFKLSPLSRRIASSNSAVGFEPDGSLIVKDPRSGGLERISRSGKPLASIAAGQITQPTAIAVDSKGDIFVIDNQKLKLIRPEILRIPMRSER
ncbi:MAG: Stp1/IreP family PP2C-type Ser/Thr phosphatase [Armatimonadetes bacterium]|nr:Stp1/IreP family PP2C-type Ser/Thr phosphatase [Armatimonadota bacterium]